MGRVHLFAFVIAVYGSGCVRYQLATPGAEFAHVDVAVVPGCPTEPDGTLSECLERRILWGAYLWQQRAVDRFITSGGAVHNRYIEAEALAAGLVTLGVPASCIWIEPHARHTDENVYYAMHAAWRHGWQTLAVASEPGHAAGGCSFVESWGEQCVVAGIEPSVLEAQRTEEHLARLNAVRVPAVPADGWLAQAEYDAQREEVVGRARPGSLALYLVVAPLRRLLSAPWYPLPSPEPVPMRYSTMLRQRGTAELGEAPLDEGVCGHTAVAVAP